MHTFSIWLTNLFPVWVVLGGALALVYPPAFTWIDNRAVTYGLALVMLGMGITLSVDDFKAVLRMPRTVAIGVVLQYTIMPLLGWGLATALQLPTPFAVGLILVACCPGGTASNVVTYIARANVALSVLMTMCSTFGAIVMTPVLTQWLAGKYVPVDGWGLFMTTVQVILLPLLLGLALHHWTPRLVAFVLPICPLISVLTVALICANIIGRSAAEVLNCGFPLLAAIFLLHAGGFGLGYLSSWLLGYDKQISRTISIEVGMQNSGLGVVLASKHFADPLTAVPCAISSVFHSVIGSFLAGVWRIRSAAAAAAPAETAAAVPVATAPAD